MYLYIMMFGNAANFDGKQGERSHIDFVKDHAVRTQRQISKFLEQVGERVTERAVLDKTIESIINQHSSETKILGCNSVLSRKREDWCVDELTCQMEKSWTMSDNDTTCVLSGCCEGMYTVLLNVNEYNKPDVKFKSDTKQKKLKGRTICHELRFALADTLLTPRRLPDALGTLFAFSKRQNQSKPVKISKSVWLVGGVLS
jgi:hypothetical protein